jgi:hypothetical protein
MIESRVLRAASHASTVVKESVLRFCTVIGICITGL